MLAVSERFIDRALRVALTRHARGGRRRGEPGVTILLVAPWGMGGTIRTVLNVAGHLAAQGWEVEILGTYRNRDRPFFGAFPPGVKVTALHDRRDGVEPRGATGLLRRALVRRSSVLVHPADRLYPEHNLWTDLRLARAVRGRSGFLMGTRPGLNLLVGRLGRPGLIAIGQEHMNLNKNVKPLRRAISVGYPRLDALVVLTDGDRRDYEQLLGGAVDVVTIPNAVTPLTGGPADPSARTVLAAGRLSRQKGFDLLLKAWALVAADFPDWRLRILGHGTERKKLRALVAKHGLGGSVSLERASAALGKDMSRASVYAVSSRFEGFPMVLLEAMSKGMTVVSFDCPTGPAEIVEDGRNGRLVPREDVPAFAAALRDVMSDEGLRRRCGEAAVDAARRYGMEAIGPRWDALLDRYAERAGAGGRPPKAPAAPSRHAALPPHLRRTIARVREEHLTYLQPQHLEQLAFAMLDVEARGLPGVVVEAGTARGGSAIVIASAKAPERPMKVYDVFGQIPPPGARDGADVHERYAVITAGGAKGPGGETYYGYRDDLYREVADSFARLGVPPAANRVELIQGLFEDTIELDEPVALAHLDGDWYESTMTCLTRIAPLLAPGGRIVLDDYDKWSGCRAAVDEYFAERPGYRFERRARLHIVREA
jgi:glycosyltransferase involved in cell wall biosynthesis